MRALRTDECTPPAPSKTPRVDKRELADTRWHSNIALENMTALARELEMELARRNERTYGMEP
jgi:hypothetical protein